MSVATPSPLPQKLDPSQASFFTPVCSSSATSPSLPSSSSSSSLTPAYSLRGSGEISATQSSSRRGGLFRLFRFTRTSKSRCRSKTPVSAHGQEVETSILSNTLHCQSQLPDASIISDLNIPDVRTLETGRIQPLHRLAGCATEEADFYRQLFLQRPAPPIIVNAIPKESVYLQQTEFAAEPRGRMFRCSAPERRTRTPVELRGPRPRHSEPVSTASTPSVSTPHHRRTQSSATAMSPTAHNTRNGHVSPYGPLGSVHRPRHLEQRDARLISNGSAKRSTPSASHLLSPSISRRSSPPTRQEAVQKKEDSLTNKTQLEEGYFGAKRVDGNRGDEKLNSVVSSETGVDGTRLRKAGFPKIDNRISGVASFAKTSRGREAHEGLRGTHTRVSGSRSGMDLQGAASTSTAIINVKFSRPDSEETTIGSKWDLNLAGVGSLSSETAVNKSSVYNTLNGTAVRKRSPVPGHVPRSARILETNGGKVEDSIKMQRKRFDEQHRVGLHDLITQATPKNAASSGSNWVPSRPHLLTSLASKHNDESAQTRKTPVLCHAYSQQPPVFPAFPGVSPFTVLAGWRGRPGGTRVLGCGSAPRAPYIGAQKKQHFGRHTLVLDLDETLVHSSFVEIPNFAFKLVVEIEGRVHSIYVAKRPGVDAFLQAMAKSYEIVMFTASLEKYANPLMNLLDPKGYCTWRLYRDSCTMWNGQFIKDLSRLGRDLRKIIILDNSPISYALQPANAIPIETWISDTNDSKLYELIPLLNALTKVDDIPAVLWKTFHGTDGF